MSLDLPRLHKPGLFITATDTDVGKTVVACAIAAALRRENPRWRIGVSKPLATGCRHDREGLVSEDAEALAHFADCRQPLSVINPVRYALAVAPSVAAEASGEPVDFPAIGRALSVLDGSSDALIIEGIGGAMVPIDGQHPKRTVLDLISAIAYPVVVVCRATLGTLNHTALTVHALRQAGCTIAGLVINGYIADSSPVLARDADVSMTTNRHWLEKMSGLPILATVPACPPATVAAQRAMIPDAIHDAVGLSYWSDLLDVASRGA